MCFMAVCVFSPQVRDEGLEGDEVVCVRWNTSLNCGSGGWQSGGCRLVADSSRSTGDLTCVCTDSGTFGILDVRHALNPESCQARNYSVYCMQNSEEGRRRFG